MCGWRHGFDFLAVPGTAAGEANGLSDGCYAQDARRVLVCSSFLLVVPALRTYQEDCLLQDAA
jgi:hypothetical protein